MNRKLKKYIKEIAALYKCKVTFIRDNSGGRYWKGRIWIGVKTSDVEIISTFCHELAHHKNTLEGKHKVYHTTDYVPDGVSKYGVRKYANIMLKAEVYTEKVGQKICRDWFPKTKYQVMYKDNQYWKAWTRGYCFSLIS